MDNFKKIGILVSVGLLLLALGYGIGRHLQPAKIEIKKEEIIKEVEVIKKDIEIIEREVTRPDGTVEKERIERDKSTETVNKDTKTKESNVTIFSKPDWKFDTLAALNKDRVLVYGIKVDRRILGNLHAGAFVLTDTTIGVSVGLEF